MAQQPVLFQLLDYLLRRVIQLSELQVVRAIILTVALLSLLFSTACWHTNRSALHQLPKLSVRSSMRLLLAALLSMFCAAAQAGVSLDSNGWTVVTPSGSYCAGTANSRPACTPATTDTRIMYVSSNPSIGHDVTGCGNFERQTPGPCRTIHYALSTAAGLRSGSPDWLLLRCGDVFVNDQPDLHWLIPGAGNGYGKSQNEPMVVSSYDPGATQSPPLPDPYSCSARPKILIDHTAANPSLGCPGGDGFNAFIGIFCYAPGRDPSNTSTTVPYYNTTDVQTNMGVIYTAASSGSVSAGKVPFSVLIEDCYIGYAGGMSITTGQYPPAYYMTNVQLRRNQIVGNYPYPAEI